MSRLLIVEPMRLSVTASRGTGAANLGTSDPKEVWADTEVGSASVILVDLGSIQTIDTILLGYVRPASDGANWSVTCGINEPSTLLVDSAVLRVPDVAGSSAAVTHALWHGAPIATRYVNLSIVQPAGSPPITAGVVVIGKAFIADFGREWGFGRQPTDTGVATSLPSGGFSVVEGVRKSLITWTFGDLSIDETDRLELIGLALGETKPGLVIEDASRTAGLRSRIHYGLFKAWRAFERRNSRQTRWEIGIEQWV